MEATYDPKIPASQQKVTYQAKDGTLKTVTKAELQEQLETSEKLMQSLNETWEQKMERTQQVQKEREKALEELGITVERGDVGVHTPKRVRRDPLPAFRYAEQTYNHVDATLGQPGTCFDILTKTNSAYAVLRMKVRIICVYALRPTSYFPARSFDERMSHLPTQTGPDNGR